MSYTALDKRLQNGEIILLDGGTGTELEKRGAAMDPEAWCGPATLENIEILEGVHRDYIAAGADIITANTYASSRLMLEPAGYADRFEEINRTAVAAAHRARDACDREDVLVAGSLSHMCPMTADSASPDLARRPPTEVMREAFQELAFLLRDAGCDLILLEMMYCPQRIPLAFEANILGEAISILRQQYQGPLTAYPDSGYFRMPSWQFEDIIEPEELVRFARAWVDDGVQVLGGCCGLSPDHISSLHQAFR
jgi:methionine synthase I (cobalamin-dependent)